MSWRMRVCHTSGYRYAKPVLASYNEARITPQTTISQTTLESRIEITPAAPVFRYWDYWSTLVHAFDVHVPHEELTVVGTSTVETADAVHPDGSFTWSELDAGRGELSEYLAPSTFVPSDGELQEWAGQLRGSSPLATVQAVIDAVHCRLEYVKGVTAVSTSAVQVFHQGEGVCQDFAHLSLATLRAVGIPARYVSGYLHRFADAAVGQSVVGESHAWIEAWLGDWYAYDPTNATVAGERHVVVARGRDYRDVSPLRGVYSGGRAERLGVTVEMTRIG